MSHPFCIAFLTVAVVTQAVTSALAVVVHDESVHGNLRWFGDRPHQFTLEPGANEIIGSVHGSLDAFDPFGFTVPVGLELDEFVLVGLSVGSSISFYDGPNATGDYIGGVSARSAPFGRNVLPLIGLPSLPAGSYSARVFGAASRVLPYHLELRTATAIPDDGSTLILGFLSLTTLAGCKRRLPA